MKARQIGAAGAALLVTLAAGVVVAVTGAPAHVNWADQRDNFVDDILVLGGLSTSDSYATTQAKANGVLAGFQSNLGANTVRLPVNFPTISSSYWNSLDVDGGSGNNNARIIQWTCNGAGNQTFQLNQVAPGAYRLIATHSGRCVDVTSASTADGATLIQYTCGSGSNQRWSLPGHP